MGSPLFDLVRIDRLKATGQVPQSSVGQVSVGQAVTVQLLDGDLLHGTVTFVAAAADPETRSFPVEVAVDNPDLKRVAAAPRACESPCRRCGPCSCHRPI